MTPELALTAVLVAILLALVVFGLALLPLIVEAQIDNWRSVAKKWRGET